MSSIVMTDKATYMIYTEEEARKLGIKHFIPFNLKRDAGINPEDIVYIKDFNPRK